MHCLASWLLVFGGKSFYTVYTIMALLVGISALCNLKHAEQLLLISKLNQQHLKSSRTEHFLTHCNINIE